MTSLCDPNEVAQGERGGVSRGQVAYKAGLCASEQSERLARCRSGAQARRRRRAASARGRGAPPHLVVPPSDLLCVPGPERLGPAASLRDRASIA